MGINTPIISAIVPSIRKFNLTRLYESMEKSFSGKFEFIVVGPYGVPDDIKDKENVIWIEDWGSPIRAQQIGLLASSGEYFCWLADDGWCLPGAFDIAYKTLEHEPYTTIVVGKYQEGERINDSMENDWYYTLSNHDSMKLSYVPKDCLLLNCGLVHRSLLIELGGWAADKFYTCPMAYNDFAIRAYRRGCKFILQQEIMFGCNHQPGTTGDHKPINDAQLEKDEPMFRGIYSHESALLRQNIPLNNWERSSTVWEERFGNGKQ